MTDRIEFDVPEAADEGAVTSADKGATENAAKPQGERTRETDWFMKAPNPLNPVPPVDTKHDQAAVALRLDSYSRVKQALKT